MARACSGAGFGEKPVFESRGNTGAGLAGEDAAVCSRRGSTGHAPLWLIRDLPVLIGVTLSVWPLVIMAIARGRKAARGRNVSPAVCKPLMLMLPLAEARLRHALDRQALCAFGRNVRGSPPKPLLFVRIRT